MTQTRLEVQELKCYLPSQSSPLGKDFGMIHKQENSGIIGNCSVNCTCFIDEIKGAGVKSTAVHM